MLSPVPIRVEWRFFLVDMQCCRNGLIARYAFGETLCIRAVLQFVTVIGNDPVRHIAQRLTRARIRYVEALIVGDGLCIGSRSGASRSHQLRHLFASKAHGHVAFASRVKHGRRVATADIDITA